MTLVLGVDGCPGGWCGVTIDAHTCSIVDARVYPSFEAVLEVLARVIGVDIPIGLLNLPGRRACDVEARRWLGRGRASSVFPPPSRRSLAFADYWKASEVNSQFTGHRLNKQSFNISPKVRAVDDVMKPGMQERVREVHPELCFWALSGKQPVRANKKTREGREARWHLLRKVLPGLEKAPSLPSAVWRASRMDDYVDALMCAWTAACIARGQAVCIPAEPEVDERGLRMEMWYPG